jgi:adenylate cyclase
VATSDALLSKATHDRSYNADNRIELARIGGVPKYLSRGLEEFLAVGDTTLAAAIAGKHEEARQASLGFANLHKPLVLTSPRFVTISPIYPTVRRTPSSDGSGLNAYLSFALFLAACGLGVGISAIGSTRVVASLRQLVASTKAVEAGTDAEPVSIKSRDEVGELAQASIA